MNKFLIDYSIYNLHRGRLLINILYIRLYILDNMIVIRKGQGQINYCRIVG